MMKHVVSLIENWERVKTISGGKWQKGEMSLQDSFSVMKQEKMSED